MSLENTKPLEFIMDVMDALTIMHQCKATQIQVERGRQCIQSMTINE